MPGDGGRVNQGDMMEALRNRETETHLIMCYFTRTNIESRTWIQKAQGEKDGALKSSHEKPHGRASQLPVSSAYCIPCLVTCNPVQSCKVDSHILQMGKLRYKAITSIVGNTLCSSSGDLCLPDPI